MPRCPGAQLEADGRGSPRNLELHRQQDKDKLVLHSWYKLTVLQVLARGVTSQGLMAFPGSHNPFSGLRHVCSSLKQPEIAGNFGAIGAPISTAGLDGLRV